MRRCVGREAGSSIVQFPYLWGFQSRIRYFRFYFLESFEAVSCRRRSFSGDSASLVGRQFPCEKGRVNPSIVVTDSDYVRAFKLMWGCLIVGMAAAEDLL